MAITANNHDNLKAELGNTHVEIEVSADSCGFLNVASLNGDDHLFIQDEESIQTFLNDTLMRIDQDTELIDCFENGWDVLTFMGMETFWGYSEAFG